MKRRLCFVLIAAFALLAAPALADDEGFIPLLRADNLSAFEVVGIAPRDLKVEDGEIAFTGMSKGYVGTRKSYKNYTLRFEWKFDLPRGTKDGDPFFGNSGLFVHGQGPPLVWPKCVEVQVWHKKEYGTFYTLGGGKFEPKRDDHQKLGRVLKPIGEWNRHEITCQDGTISVKVNDEPIARGQNANPDHGRIGWMSEDGPVRFRKLRIKTLDPR